MKNKLFLSFLTCICLSLPIMAEVPVIGAENVPKVTAEPKPAVVTTNFENCVKTYNTSVDNLFYLTLSAINAANYKIDEMQSRTGLISFAAGGKTLLVSITQINSNTSMIKITPADNSYAFSPVIPDRIFNYLTNNIK